MATFNATDSNFITSAAWIIQGTALATNRVGAYINGKFNGTSLSVNVTADNTRKLGYQIDDTAHQEVTLANNTSTISLASGLSAGEHKFSIFYTQRGDNVGNRFDGFDVKVNSITCDSLVAPLTPASKTLYLYGDSIFSSYAGGSHPDSISMALREGLRPLWKVSSFAIGGTGWLNTGGGGMLDIRTHWKTAWSGQAYSNPEPTAAYICMGTNDRSQTDAAVQSAVESTLTDMLTTWSNTRLILQTPWEGIKRTAVIAGHTAINNSRVSLVDLELEYSRGLGASADDYYSPDDVHPNYKSLLGIVSRMGLELGNHTTIPTPSPNISGALTATGTFTYV